MKGGECFMINIKQIMKVAKPLISVLAIAVPIASSLTEKAEMKETFPSLTGVIRFLMSIR